MNNRILEFFKTEHFILRQWQRGCSDYLINLPLRFINISKNVKKLIIIVYPSFYSKFKIDFKRYLVIIIKGMKLVTVFCKRNTNIKKEKGVKIIHLKK
jgi:hypothetical protein